MKKQLDQVAEFQGSFGLFIGDSPSMPPDKGLLLLRQRLIMEEAFEVSDELVDGESIEGTAKELADLVYVTLGTVLTLGLQDQFERCFDEVHRSNMSKLDENGKPIYREDGKVLKSKLYTPADLSFLKQ